MKTYLLNSTKALSALALISGALAVTAPAIAAPTQTHIVTTTIDARDLETDRGVAKIYKTLARRAENACSTSGHKPISARRAEDACAQDLLIDFVQDVDDERLTSYFEKMQS